MSQQPPSSTTDQALELLPMKSSALSNDITQQIEASPAAVIQTHHENPQNSGDASTSTAAGASASAGEELTIEQLWEKEIEEERNARFWSVTYYRSFFRVTTRDVAHRLLLSLFPYPGLFWKQVQDRPDLYGPFWVNTTLILVLGISANFSSYIDWYFDKDSDHDEGNDEWAYEIDKVTMAAFVVYFYAFVLPLLLYFVVPSEQTGMKFMHICTIVGYAMTIFIPMTILATYPQAGIRWAAISIAYLISASFMAINFWEPIQFHSKTWGLVCIGVMLVLHLGVALLFRFYFYSY